MGSFPSRSRLRKRLMLLTYGTLATMAALAAACGGGEVSRSEFETLQQEVVELRSLLERAGETSDRALLVASLPVLQVAQFHSMDDLINNEAMIHATHPGIVTRAISTLQAPIWPTDLNAHVAGFLTALQTLEGPILNDDAQAAGRPVRVVHAHAHAFEEAVNAFLRGEAVPPPPEISNSTEPMHDHQASQRSEQTAEEHDMGSDRMADEYGEESGHYNSGDEQSSEHGESKHE